MFSNYIEVGDCHEWQGSSYRNQPYTCVKIDGDWVKLPVRRNVWLQAGRTIPNGQVVYAHCCNWACIRLEHLRCVKRGKHLTQRAAAGQAKHPPSTLASLTRAARKRSTTKYSMEQARQARAIAATEGLSVAQIAERTGMSYDATADVLRGRRWKESLSVSSAFNWKPPARSKTAEDNAKR